MQQTEDELPGIALVPVYSIKSRICAEPLRGGVFSVVAANWSALDSVYQGIGDIKRAGGVRNEAI